MMISKKIRAFMEEFSGINEETNYVFRLFNVEENKTH
jgi:hypothetical protein